MASLFATTSEEGSSTQSFFPSNEAGGVRVFDVTQFSARRGMNFGQIAFAFALLEPSSSPAFPLTSWFKDRRLTGFLHDSVEWRSLTPRMEFIHLFRRRRRRPILPLPAAPLPRIANSGFSFLLPRQNNRYTSSLTQCRWANETRFFALPPDIHTRTHDFSKLFFHLFSSPATKVPARQSLRLHKEMEERLLECRLPIFS